jgi:hypothetical protein
MKRLDNQMAFIISKNGKMYVVILERINNDINGNPRYKAIITFNDFQECEKVAYVYTFTGHYCGEKGEAEYILNRHLR